MFSATSTPACRSRAWRELPGIAEIAARLPLARADGPLRIDWQVLEAEWGWLIAQLSDQLPLSEELQSSRIRLGSWGSLEFDPRQPLTVSGEIVVEGLEIARQEVFVVAEGPLQLRLDGGELVLEPVRLRSEGGLLEIEAWINLEDDWLPGDPFEAALRRLAVEANGIAPMALLEGFVDDIYTDGDLQLALSVSGTTRELSGELRVVGPEARLAIADPEGLMLSQPDLEVVFEAGRLRMVQARVGIGDAEIVATGEVPLTTLFALIEKGARDPTEPLEPMVLSWESAAGRVGGHPSERSVWKSLPNRCGPAGKVRYGSTRRGP